MCAFIAETVCFLFHKVKYIYDMYSVYGSFQFPLFAQVFLGLFFKLGLYQSMVLTFGKKMKSEVNPRSLISLACSAYFKVFFMYFLGLFKALNDRPAAG